MSEEQVYIGEFPVDPSTIVEAALPEKGVKTLLKIDKAERRVGKESGNPYINFELSLPENPEAGKLFHMYGLSAKALSNRSSGISWKKFLDKVNLPHTTTASELAGFQFIATLRHKGQGDEAEAQIDSIVSAA